jgi:hypothetical protein
VTKRSSIALPQWHGKETKLDVETRKQNSSLDELMITSFKDELLQGTLVRLVDEVTQEPSTEFVNVDPVDKLAVRIESASESLAASGL